MHSVFNAIDIFGNAFCTNDLLRRSDKALAERNRWSLLSADRNHTDWIWKQIKIIFNDLFKIYSMQINYSCKFHANFKKNSITFNQETDTGFQLHANKWLSIQIARNPQQIKLNELIIPEIDCIGYSKYVSSQLVFCSCCQIQFLIVIVNHFTSFSEINSNNG